MQLTVVDEVAGAVEPVGTPVGTIAFVSPTITVRELIRARVDLHIEQMREMLGASSEATGRGFGGLLNDGDRASPRVDALVAQAEEGFVRGSYYILFDDAQAETLDETVDLAATTAATFLLLTPLKGG